MDKETHVNAYNEHQQIFILDQCNNYAENKKRLTKMCGRILNRKFHLYTRANIN